MLVRIAVSAKGLLAFALLAGLVACGGSSGTKTLYVVGVGTPEVAQFSVAGSGALTLVRPIGVGAAPSAVAVTPDNRYAYVLNSALGSPAGAVSQFTLNRTSGALTAQTESTTTSATTGSGIPVPPIPVGTTPVSMAVDEKSSFVFVANQGDNSISVFTIDHSSGALTAVANPQQTGSTELSVAPAVGPSALAVRGNTLFVANQTGGISVFTFDPKTGVLTQASGSPFAASTNFCSPNVDATTGAFMPCSIDLDAKGDLLYVPNKAANAVAVFSVGTGGALSQMTSFATGTMPVAVRVHRSGKFIYVANWGTGDITILAVAAGDHLAPVLGSPYPSGANPSYILNDTRGEFMFVTNAGAGTVSAFAVNGKTGTLAPAANSPFIAVGSAMGMATIN